MKRLRRFGTSEQASAFAATQIRTLIASIDLRARLLDCDIEAEEQWSRFCTVAPPPIQI